MPVRLKANPLVMLTWSALKAYLRSWQALFFSLLVPILIMAIFGLLNFGGSALAVDVGVVDDAHNQVSQFVLQNLRTVKAVKLHTGSLGEERAALIKGDRALVVVLPPGLGAGPAALTAYYNVGQPQNSQAAIGIMSQYVDRASFAFAHVQPSFTLDTQPVQSRNLTYVDFLVPGIIALSIMQTGLFSVVFVFVQLKQRGVLRRLMATPMRVNHFFFSQITTRVVVALLQLIVLLAVGLFAFHFHFQGNLVAMLFVGVIGAAIFIAMGLAISGYAKSEETAAPLANIISLPLMFLSGVFFPRAAMPGWLQTITQYSPLTYVSDALRSISVDGATLWAVRTDLLGIVIWLAICAFAATRLFKWEVA
ncbi:MAG TPA: ABC transporter permease [Candidatus Limnocylindrales bacterium]|nr:ABC transporter permease [Candidatus Limnocylindrales bacterium]